MPTARSRIRALFLGARIAATPFTLSREEAAALAYILERAPAVSVDQITPTILDHLVARGLVRLPGGMLVISIDGIFALNRDQHSAQISN